MEKELAAKEKALRLIELKGVDLSPLQSEAIEKEIQGVLTSLRLQEFNELLSVQVKQLFIYMFQLKKMTLKLCYK